MDLGFLSFLIEEGLFLEHERLSPPFIIDFAQEVLALLVNLFDFRSRQLEIDGEDHYFVPLHAHHNGEDDEAGEDHD